MLNQLLQSSRKNTQQVIIAFVLCCLIVVNFSCSSSKKSSIEVIASSMNKDKMPTQPYNSVFIIALTQNMNVRSSLENELAAAAQSHGIKATRSLAVFTPVTGVPD